MTQRQSPSGPITGFRTSVTLDFGTIAAGTQASLTSSVPGLSTSDVLVANGAASTGNIVFTARCATANVVTVTASNLGTQSADPASGDVALYVLR